MRKKYFFSITLVSLILLFLRLSAYAVPDKISYQGKLTYESGDALPNKSYTMRFSLYNHETDGDFLWQEQQSVEVIEGIYSIHLGAEEPLSENLFINHPKLYLEIEIWY